MFFFVIPAFADGVDSPREPVTGAFYGFGKNFLASLFYGYGATLFFSGVETFAMVKTGLDWKYYEAAYGKDALRVYGMTANITGYITPAAIPVITYSLGVYKKDGRLQNAGLALAQSAMIATAMNIVLKAASGRRQAGLYDLDPQREDYSGEFSPFNIFSGVIDGWPSGHTMNAVAAAVTISELYAESPPVIIAAYSYAAALSVGMTFCDHWASDVIAGWILGYGIGKTVGRGFTKRREENKVSPDIRPNYLGVRVVY
ncbi:MAG: phosphatase PAP2 family protein [Spirochaetaceae bacterium]|nr:phosphatase PAP2 family protein [Spirochaetaceae bacterium]